MPTSKIDTIHNAKLENAQQFEECFKSYYSVLCHYAVQYVKTNEQAEEIVQELFYQVWKNRGRLAIHSSLKAYLFRATYLNCMDWLRKNKTRNTLQQNEMLRGQLYFTETTIDQNEIHQIIEHTLKSMPKRVRGIFTMSRFDGLKYHEIAKKLSISIKTVEASMGKALKLFRTNLKDYRGLFLL